MSVIRDASIERGRFPAARANLIPRPGAASPAQSGAREGTAWVPAVDIQEAGDRTFVRADLPGVLLEQIELRIEGDRLTIQGERRAELGHDSSQTHLRERPSGRFLRSFELPPDIDQGGIRAELRHGVLEVMLPKKPTSSGRSIKVEAR